MYQIDNSTASATRPASTSQGAAGFFTDGNPATGNAATVVPAEFLNMLMMESVNLIKLTGLNLDKSDSQQLYKAIRRLVQKSSILNATGSANAIAAINESPLVAGDLISGMMQKVSIVATNTGASTYAPDGLAAKPIYGLGHAALQGGELFAGGIATLMYLVTPSVNGGSGAWILQECTGGALAVPPATQGNHAVNLGQFTGSPSSGYAKIPSGPGQPPLILQWGGSGSTNAGNTITAALPIQFPTVNMRQFLTPANGTSWYPYLANTNTSMVTGLNSGSSSGGFNFLCVGY